MIPTSYQLVWSTSGDPPSIGDGTLAGRCDVPRELPVAVFVGDSYTAGAHVTAPDYRFTTLIAAAMNWSEANLGRGGTGYITPVTDGAMTACGMGYCPSYREMIPAVVDAAPAVVVVSGGRNDEPRPWPDIAAGIGMFFAELRAALPDVLIIATSPIWDATPAPVALVAMCTVVRRAARSVGGVFVDLGDPLLGRTDRIAADGVHPNDAGHAAIADAFISAQPVA